ncbi:uncharacterized protein BDZ83DRAFT_33607 [Colletotrichum acutatum]|uniref:Secreted protein n=1 Tax=Glomerella acutata TaxID=27357 RepID=A0AAD8XLD7_GLOAC|nr:uncharacterized protein BDZ83DRAFT_33607 [Colletotrichum acutatum]KAK1729492.1 hypothetical protein BDZ83DRAFT_33607 [Colletotrichum acutatum]
MYRVMGLGWLAHRILPYLMHLASRLEPAACAQNITEQSPFCQIMDSQRSCGKPSLVSCSSITTMPLSRSVEFICLTVSPSWSRISTSRDEGVTLKRLKRQASSLFPFQSSHFPQPTQGELTRQCTPPNFICQPQFVSQ